MPNRLNIHPSYKWITGHLGDVSMTFSPYTLNGHLFTGAGVELQPEGWDIALMYGRLLKAIEYDRDQPAVSPAYRRMAYGVKAGRKGEKHEISINFLSAKDDASSLTVAPDSLGITPAENLAGSVFFLLRPVKFIEFSGEYGLSLLTSDSRAPKGEEKSIYDSWEGRNMTTSSCQAFKVRLDYVGASSRLGVGYERIDPGYKTLGAYYFANDLENITLNVSQSLWQSKVNINLSMGLERDDLSRTNATSSSRTVGSASVTVSPTERVNLNLSYTNFQTYSNVRSNFELINRENPLDQPDTLRFVQLSRSANFNLNLVTKKTEEQLHNLGINMAYQDAAGKQGGVFRPGSVTEMVNASTSYSWSLLKSGLTLNGVFNLNNSRMMSGNMLTWGPTLGLKSQFWDKRAMAGASLSYNSGYMERKRQNEVFLCRINTSYSPAQSHSITVSYDFQWRSVVERTAGNTSLLTAGYSYNF
jgi:hypothetical protein